jgi:hypothetical protein
LTYLAKLSCTFSLVSIGVIIKSYLEPKSHVLVTKISSALISRLLSQSFPSTSTSKNLKVGLWAVAILTIL